MRWLDALRRVAVRTYVSFRSWPRAARLTTILLLFLVASLAVLWATGRRFWVGPWTTDAVGSLGEWVAGFAAVVTVGVAVIQFSRTRAAELDHQERAEAMKISAWAGWTSLVAQPPEASGVAASPAEEVDAEAKETNRRVTVLNGAQGALFDWNVTVVPSTPGWVEYVRMSARIGQLPPGERVTIQLNHPPADVDVRRCGSESRPSGIPRFVVLAFTDAWGGGWIRVNGDLQRVPRESHFLPRLVHLRNPAMPWAGILDQAQWAAFREAAALEDELPDELSMLVPSEHSEFPWLGRDAVKKYASLVRGAKLRNRGTRTHSLDERNVRRSVRRAAAFYDTRRFFDVVSVTSKGEVLFLSEI